MRACPLRVHTVFLRFSNLVLTKNLSPSAAADLIRASSDFYENGLFALPPAGDQHISCSSIYFMIYFFPYMVNLRFFNFIRNFYTGGGGDVADPYPEIVL